MLLRQITGLLGVAWRSRLQCVGKPQRQQSRCYDFPTWEDQNPQRDKRSIPIQCAREKDPAIVCHDNSHVGNRLGPCQNQDGMGAIAKPT